MRTIVISIMAGLMFLLTSQAGFCQDTAITSEVEPVIEHGKFGTADASPLDPGVVEMEFGYSYTRAGRYADAHSRLHARGLFEEHSPTLTRTMGIIENADVNIGIGFLGVLDEEGEGPRTGSALGDLGFGGRYRFLNLAEEKIEAAVIGGFTAPTGTASTEDKLGTSQEFWSWENAFVVTKDWSNWTTNAEIGYIVPFGGKRGHVRGALAANFALGYQAFVWLQPVAELNYSRDFFAGERDGENLALTAGAVMPISDLLRVNAGLQYGLWGRNVDQAFAFLFSMKFAY